MSRLQLKTFDTRGVRKSERISFWESSCTTDMVGLSCMTMEEDGLQARFDYYSLDALSVFDIVGKQHVICRSTEAVRKHGKDSVFLIHLLEGTAFVNRARKCELLNAGDVVLYDTNEAYMHGFAEAARQVIFDLPGAEFRARFADWDLSDALRINGNGGNGATIASSLQAAYSDVCSHLYRTPEPLQTERIWSVLELIHDLVFGGSRVSSYNLEIIRRVRSSIRALLDDPKLDTAKIADDVGMSSRHLNRVLALRGQTVRKLIVAERLDRARRLIEDAGSSKIGLAELAFTSGFSSSAQFSKNFRNRFGSRPSEVGATRDTVS